jgi:hypothetical protein
VRDSLLSEKQAHEFYGWYLWTCDIWTRSDKKCEFCIIVVVVEGKEEEIRSWEESWRLQSAKRCALCICCFACQDSTLIDGKAANAKRTSLAIFRMLLIKPSNLSPLLLLLLLYRFAIFYVTFLKFGMFRHSTHRILALAYQISVTIFENSKNAKLLILTIMASTWTIMVLVNSDHFVELKYGLHFEIESVVLEKSKFEFLKWGMKNKPSDWSRAEGDTGQYKVNGSLLSPSPLLVPPFAPKQAVITLEWRPVIGREPPKTHQVMIISVATRACVWYDFELFRSLSY